MILDECHYALWIRIEIVVAEHIVETIHAVPPVIGLFFLCTVDAVEESEIHNGWQIAVLLRKFAVLLPGCSIGRFSYPSLAYGIEVRILLAQHLHPVCHCIAVGIRIGIHTDAVDTCTLYPPLAVLNQILDNVWVTLVEVRHGWNKPAIYGFSEINLAGVWVKYRSQLITGLQILIVHLGSAIHCTDVLLMLGSLIFRSQPFRCIEPVL